MYQTPRFEINKSGRIIELSLNGLIKSIWITPNGIQYQVRYFWNSEAKEIYFYEDELQAWPQ